MSSRTTRLASGLIWRLVTKVAIVKPGAAAAAGATSTASRSAHATSARTMPSAPERDAGHPPILRAVELEVPPRMELEERRDDVRREGLDRLDEVRHEVGAPLELDVDVRPRLVRPLAQPDELVVAADDQEDEPGDYEEKHHAADGHPRPSLALS